MSKSAAKKQRQQARMAHAQDELLEGLDAVEHTRGTRDVCNKLINEGHDALEAGDGQKAMRLFERARSKALQFSTTTNALRTERLTTVAIADAHQMLGNYEQCVAEHTRAIELDKQGVKTNLTPDIAKREKDNLENALYHAADACLKRGQAALESGSQQDALEALEEGLGFAKRIVQKTVNSTLERQFRSAISEALVHLGFADATKYKRAIKEAKKALQGSMDARDAQLAQRARGFLNMALLGALGRRFGLALDGTELRSFPTETATSAASADGEAAEGQEETPTRVATAAAEESTDVEILSVKALRELITKASLSTDGCLEKADLRYRAREALVVLAGAEGSSSNDISDGDASLRPLSADESERAAKAFLEAVACTADENLLVKSAVELVCKTPRLQADALLLTGLHKERAKAEAWCIKLGRRAASGAGANAVL